MPEVAELEFSSRSIIALEYTAQNSAEESAPLPKSFLTEDRLTHLLSQWLELTRRSTAGPREDFREPRSFECSEFRRTTLLTSINPSPFNEARDEDF